MVELKGIEKSFGKLPVLRGIDAVAESGKVTAVLGPNGSGKTTLIKCILGLVVPDRGEIRVGGRLTSSGPGYRERIGYLPQIARFPENLTVSELLSMIADIRKQTGRRAELIRFFEMENHIGKKLKNLSGGTRQKVNAILAFMFDADLYILDEPTAGLDPISRVTLKEKITEEKSKGKTVVLTSHILSEVDELADDLIFILEGKIYYRGAPTRLKEEQKADSLEKAIAAMLLGEKYKKEKSGQLVNNG